VAEQPESLPAARPQTPIFAPTSLDRFVRGAVPGTTGQTDGAAGRQPKRDSIRNGVLIGAAIGGVGGSALIVASSGGSDDIARAMWTCRCCRRWLESQRAPRSMPCAKSGRV